MEKKINRRFWGRKKKGKKESKMKKNGAFVVGCPRTSDNKVTRKKDKKHE